MGHADLNLQARSLILTTIAATLVFSLFGSWVFNELVNYGLVLYSPATFSQELAMSLAAANSLPVFAVFPDTNPASRVSMALNGAVWGVLLYVLAKVGMHFLQRIKRSVAAQR